MGGWITYPSRSPNFDKNGQLPRGHVIVPAPSTGVLGKKKQSAPGGTQITQPSPLGPFTHLVCGINPRKEINIISSTAPGCCGLNDRHSTARRAAGKKLPQECPFRGARTDRPNHAPGQEGGAARSFRHSLFRLDDFTIELKDISGGEEKENVHSINQRRKKYHLSKVDKCSKKIS